MMASGLFTHQHIATKLSLPPEPWVKPRKLNTNNFLILIESSIGSYSKNRKSINSLNKLP